MIKKIDFFRIKNIIFVLSILLSHSASSKILANEKGLLPEIGHASGTVQTDDRKDLASEILISKSEEKAIESLHRILKKNRGKEQEPDLLYRLAELYMRRSKSGRFFDLQRDPKQLQEAMSQFKAFPPSGKLHIQKAINIYTEIQNKFPQYPAMDEVLFNNAFAHQQINLEKKSLDLYEALTDRFPHSPLAAEALMGRGEILYNQGNFSESLENFQALSSHKNSRTYVYGMYKAAWALYNIKNSKKAVEQLLLVLNHKNEKYDMRREALKDLVLFTSDFYKTDEIYAFFKKNIRIDEMELVILDLSNLFFSHARYQELNAFMDKFLKDFPDSPLSVQVHIFFAKNYESLKKRDHVVASFTKANELCSPNSAWRNKTSKEMVQDSCFMKLRSFQQELTTKWWEIWEKNKNHSDFNELLISFLRSAIQNEAFDTEEINKKTRYLLAELLFHNKKYLEASQEYFLVGEQSREPKLRHDSYYAALFSYGKYSEQNPESISTPETQKQILILAEQYLEFSPEGAYSDDVHLKLAILFLAQKDYNRAENHLKPLWVSKEETLRSKAQDAKLELLNIQKNFRELKELSAEWAKNTPASIRRKALEKISKEAEFNEIVLGKTSHEKILEYARHNKESSLGREALWKILSNSFSLKKDKDAMAYGEEFIKYFPEDKEASIVRKELISIYLDYGFFKKAASLMGKSPDLSVQDHEKQGDFFQLENMWKLAYESYLPLLNKFPIGSRDYLRIYEKIEDLSQKDTSIITHSISNQLARRGLEPFATRALVRSAENLFNERKYTEAFEISRKINSREVSPEEKFSARILQAQVLEKEFISQSMKASPERFPLVFNIKVEKFDKAFSAYSDALLLTSKPEKQLLALIGIQNNFKHFISALENLSGPPSVDGKEKLNLKHEMAELLSAIKQRQIENQEKIKSLQNRSLPNLSSHRTLAFLQDPKTIQDWPLWISQRPDFKSMSRSRNKGNLWKSEDILDDINNSELREWNLYRLAVEAYQEQKYEKTNFLLSQMKIPTSAGNYLRGSLFIKQNKFNEASKEFQILLEKDTDIEELKILTSFESFDRKDHLTVIDNLEKLKIFPRRDLHVVSIYVDSLIESGYREKAEKFLSSSAAGERDSAVKTALLSKLENISVNSKNYIRSRSSTSEEKENLKLEVK